MPMRTSMRMPIHMSTLRVHTQAVVRLDTVRRDREAEDLSAEVQAELELVQVVLALSSVDAK